MTIAFICGILVVPVMDAQRRPGTNGNRPSTTAGTGSRNGGRTSSAPSRSQGNSGSQTTGRNGGSRTPDRQQGSRPGNSNGGNSGATRNPGNKPGAAPGRNNGASSTPGRNDSRRPSTPGHSASRRQPSRPAPRPGVGHPSRPARPHVAAPVRHQRPPMRPYSRPLPPPSFRPHHGCPVIHGILGLTFGTAIGLSLDYLYNGGYTVDSYSNDVVYLRNVSAMSYVWPDATLRYTSAGLASSHFMYSTSYYDLTRYNSLYDSLVAQYGSPVNYEAVNNGYVATWFGYDNGYISLEYGPQYTTGGHLRYFTTLTFGN